MTSATPHPCPQCQQTFQPSRRNQQYCSSQCRIDANNDKAQQKYTDYRQQTTQAAANQQQLIKLEDFLQQQILIAQDIEEITLTKIQWNGHLYKRLDVATIKLQKYRIALYPGGGVYVIATKELVYRRVCDQKVREPFLYKRID